MTSPSEFFGNVLGKVAEDITEKTLEKGKEIYDNLLFRRKGKKLTLEELSIPDKRDDEKERKKKDKLKKFDMDNLTPYEKSENRNFYKMFGLHKIDVLNRMIVIAEKDYDGTSYLKYYDMLLKKGIDATELERIIRKRNPEIDEIIRDIRFIRNNELRNERIMGAMTNEDARRNQRDRVFVNSIEFDGSPSNLPPLQSKSPQLQSRSTSSISPSTIPPLYSRSPSTIPSTRFETAEERVARLKEHFKKGGKPWDVNQKSQLVNIPDNEKYNRYD